MGMARHYVAIDSETLDDILDIDPNDFPTIDIDKSWYAIHYMIYPGNFETKPPELYVIPMIQTHLIGDNLDFEALYLTLQQVKEVTNYLSSLKEHDIK